MSGHSLCYVLVYSCSLGLLRMKFQFCVLGCHTHHKQLIKRSRADNHTCLPRLPGTLCHTAKNLQRMLLWYCTNPQNSQKFSAIQCLIHLSNRNVYPPWLSESTPYVECYGIALLLNFKLVIKLVNIRTNNTIYQIRLTKGFSNNRSFSALRE